MKIQKAKLEDHHELSELTKKSKAYWGYGEEQIKAWASDLTITSKYIEKHSTIVLRKESEIVAYYSYFAMDEHTAYLDNLFVHPDEMGKGYGKLLLLDFFKSAKMEGFTKASLDSDPHAEPFYKSFGFKTVGQKETSITSRFLPIMEKVF